MFRTFLIVIGITLTLICGPQSRALAADPWPWPEPYRSRALILIQWLEKDPTKVVIALNALMDADPLGQKGLDSLFGAPDLQDIDIIRKFREITARTLPKNFQFRLEEKNSELLAGKSIFHATLRPHACQTRGNFNRTTHEIHGNQTDGTFSDLHTYYHEATHAERSLALFAEPAESPNLARFASIHYGEPSSLLLADRNYKDRFKHDEIETWLAHSRVQMEAYERVLISPWSLDPVTLNQFSETLQSQANTNLAMIESFYEQATKDLGILEQNPKMNQIEVGPIHPLPVPENIRSAYHGAPIHPRLYINTFTVIDRTQSRFFEINIASPTKKLDLPSAIDSQKIALHTIFPQIIEHRANRKLNSPFPSGFSSKNFTLLQKKASRFRRMIDEQRHLKTLFGRIEEYAAKDRVSPFAMTKLLADWTSLDFELETILLDEMGFQSEAKKDLLELNFQVRSLRQSAGFCVYSLHKSN